MIDILSVSRYAHLMIKVAALQMAAGDNKAENLNLAEDMILRAARDGAELVVLPEMFSFRGSFAHMAEEAEPLNGPTLNRIAYLAKSNYISILAGTIAEKIEGVDGKFYNTAVLLDQNGHERLVYRKVHLFDVNLPRVSITESEHMVAGDELPVAEMDGFNYGCLICYDLRFPGAARTLRIKGMDILLVPANFLADTGKAHWEPLVRARAIENGVFVIAANQYGLHPESGFESYGRSMIVDPWGTVLNQKLAGDGVIAAELDPALIKDARERIPVHVHRKPDLYLN